MEPDPFFDDPGSVATEEFCKECHGDRVHDPSCSKLEFKTLEERAAGESIVILAKKSRTPYQCWCPACEFMFERTTVGHIRAWAPEHNDKKHNGQLKIIDMTLHDPQQQPAKAIPTATTNPLLW